MDPKSLSNIDPKLRETYERVMGTTAAPASPATPPNAPIQADAPPAEHPAAEHPSEELSPAPSLFAPPFANNPATNDTPQQPPVQVVTPYNPENAAQANVGGQPMAQPLPSPASVAQATHAQDSAPLLRVLYIVGAVLFFIIYTIFWIKIFKLPFIF